MQTEYVDPPYLDAAYVLYWKAFEPNSPSTSMWMIPGSYKD